MIKSRTLGLAAGIFAALFTAVATAWACTVQPIVLGVTPMVVSPGDQIRVEGTGASAASPVELHWNSAAGPVLGTAKPDAGVLQATVTVPDSAPGIYTLVAVVPQVGVARAAVEVVPADSKGKGGSNGSGAVSNGLWNGFSGGTASSQVDPASLSTSSNTSATRAIGGGLLAVGTLSMASLLVARLRTRSHARPDG